MIMNVTTVWAHLLQAEQYLFIDVTPVAKNQENILLPRGRNAPKCWLMLCVCAGSCLLPAFLDPHSATGFH